MAGLVTPTVGENEDLGRILNKVTPDDVMIHLYTNNLTPAEADVIGDYDTITAAEHAAAGPKTLAGASWTISEGTASFVQQTFTFAGAEPEVYGYVVTNNAGTIVMWAEEFSDGSYAIPAGGGTIKITPTITLD